MRTLLDEYGQFVITLIVVSILVLSVIFGVVMPRMRTYTQVAIPSDATENAADFIAIAENIDRASPTITADNMIVDQNTVIDFAQYITNGKIEAVNADGLDISEKIIIRPANEETALFYDGETKKFTCQEAGEYKFILSVKDITDDEYFGKEQKTVMIVMVEKVEETTPAETSAT